MTISEYREKYGADYEAQRNKPWFVALLMVIAARHPLKSLSLKSDGDKLAGAAVYLNRIDGYEKCAGIFDELDENKPAEKPEPESTFEEEEIQ